MTIDILKARDSGASWLGAHPCVFCKGGRGPKDLMLGDCLVGLCNEFDESEITYAP